MSESQDLQELQIRLLRGIGTVEPRATECYPGTRTRILDEVVTTAADRDGKNIILILGAPGSGKSSISLSAMSRLRDQDMLVTYFRFDRHDSATTTTAALWRLVAADLARRFPSLQPDLLQRLRNDEVDLNSAMGVFNSLVHGPLSSITDDRPSVVVIDALDECGGLQGTWSPDRTGLLQTLRRWPQLPKCFKLLVTSSKSDIIRVLTGISTQIDIPSGRVMTENPHAETSICAARDIRIYLEYKFQRIRNLYPSSPANWLGTRTILQMSYCAAGNFTWVTSATDFIESGIELQARLERVMADTLWTSKPLYSLYTIILEAAFQPLDSRSAEADALRSVLGIMVVAKRRFCDEEYTKLPTSKPVTDIFLAHVRDRLRSVISPGASLCFAHTSFDDFLLSEECLPKYRIRKDESEHLLAQLCLTTMNRELHFNLCHLETSYSKNADIPDIGETVTRYISPLLSYSCSFWAEHLYLTPFNQRLLYEVKNVFSDKLLYWFEAMSLLEKGNRIEPSLLLLLKWMHISRKDEFREFVHDACQFTRVFGQPIAQSVPHIYISALAFAPEYSIFADHFRPRFPDTFTLSTGKTTDWSSWSSCLFTFQHHKDWVNFVAFSPDEERFISGSADGTVCIGDSSTGDLISGPFEVASPVSRVSFDPDGRHAWASSYLGKTFRLDIETGNTVLYFQAGLLDNPMFYYCLSGEQSIVCASREQGAVTVWNADTDKRLRVLAIGDGPNIFSCSPNGYRIACLGPFDDKTLIIWKLGNGNNLVPPPGSQPQSRHSEPISALSFSADSNFVVSGSEDGTILRWNAATNNTVSHSLVTGSAQIDAVAYHPQSDLIVSASGCPGTVMVYDALTHEMVFGPLNGHTSGIRSLALSYDGTRAMTSSRDRTVRMWDLGRRGRAGVVFTDEGHMFKVECVAFSPSGEKIVSVDLKEIRVWDANTGKSSLPPIRSVSFTRVIFSPDDRYIVACDTDDGTIRVWDANTGLLHQDLTVDNEERISIKDLSFRSTDHQLLVISENSIRAWNLESGSTPENFSSKPSLVNALQSISILVLSPDGLTALVRDDNRYPRHHLWSTTKCEPLPVNLEFDEKIADGPMVYSPSGRLFAVACCGPQDTTTLRVWDIQSGLLAAKPSTLDGVVHLLAFSPDDRYIAFSSTTDSTAIWIWEVYTDSLAAGPWGGHAGDITALAFSPDSKKLVLGSDDGWIRIWDTANLPGDSQGSAGTLGVGRYMQDGWIVDADKRLLFWVPIDRRAGLVSPGTVAVSGRGISTKLDLTMFRYGKHWTECFRGED